MTKHVRRGVAGLLAAASLAPAAWIEAQGSGGLYRQSDQAAVVFNYAPDLYCRVQNEDQMAAYGGFERVQVVSQLPRRGRPTGDCGWPNGFYRRSDEAAVYRLSGVGVVPYVGGDICHVVDEQQMSAFGGFAQVRVVSPESDLGRGRWRVTDCVSP